MIACSTNLPTTLLKHKALFGEIIYVPLCNFPGVDGSSSIFLLKFCIHHRDRAKTREEQTRLFLKIKMLKSIKYILIAQALCTEGPVAVLFHWQYGEWIHTEFYVKKTTGRLKIPSGP